MKGLNTGIFGKMAASKMAAERALQRLGQRIRKNIDQGQRDYDAGKVGYGSIDLFK